MFFLRRLFGITKTDFRKLLENGACIVDVRTQKEFNSGNNEIIPEGLLGGNVDWTISSRQKVTVGTTWYPDYEDVNNYRVVTNAAWNITLNMKNDLTFSVGFHHEYNSIVDPGIKKSDLQITAGIEYSF